MKKVFHLSTCNTCQRIIKELGGLADFEHQNLKEKNISADELAFLQKHAGSYEALFSRRSMKYRAWGLHEKELSEEDMLNYMVEEYTFIKRPVMVFDDGTTLSGFSKKQVEAVIK